MDAITVFGIVSLISLVASLIPFLWMDKKPKLITVWVILSIVCFLLSLGLAMSDDPGVWVGIAGYAFGFFVLLCAVKGTKTTRAEREAAYKADTTPVKAVLLQVKQDDGLGALIKVALGEKAFGWAGAVVAAEELDKYAIFEVTYASGRVGQEKVKVGTARFEELWELIV